MSGPEYPIPAHKMVETLSKICRCQDRLDLVEVLESAHARFELIESDGWNGGTYTYRLHLELPVEIFASYQTQEKAIEKELLEKVASIDKAYDNDHIGEVLITPISAGSAGDGQRFVPSEIETNHLWRKGFFRLFLSHVVEHKVEVRELKSMLELFGVSAFVAHEDIQPSKEWQNEIELALRSMDSLAALVTPGFLESRWCDQEVGWAFGRGVPVLPVRLGCDPHGFSGKFQAISGTLDASFSLAQSIFNTLRGKPESQRSICRALPNALMLSRSFSHSTELSKCICEYADYTGVEKSIIWKACDENKQVHGAWGVTESLYKHIGNPPSLQKEEEEIPF